MAQTTATAAALKIRPVVLSGPSGGGKSTLLKVIMEKYPDCISFSISHTSRMPRPGEKDGKEYYFVNRERMQEMIKNNELIEHTEFAGNFYGTSRAEVVRIQKSGRMPVLDVDLAGVKSIKAIPSLESRFLFISPPSLAVLEQRLRARNTETEAKIRERIALAKGAMDYAEQKDAYDLVIVNDDLNTAAAALEGFLFEDLNAIKNSKFR